MGEDNAAFLPVTDDSSSPLPQVSDARMGAVLETAVHKSIRPIATALAFVYLPFSLIPVIRSGAAGVPLTAVTLAFAFAMLALRSAADRIPERWAHPTVGLTVGLLITRSLLGWWFYGGDSETGFVSGGLMTSGLACLSWPWVVSLNFFGIAGWTLILGFSQYAWPQSYVLLLLLAGPGLAVVLRKVRIEGLRREDSFRIRDERTKKVLATAFRAIEQSEERFRGIVERIHDVFCRTDLDGNLELVSPSVERYGYRPEELIGKPVHILHSDASQVSEGIRLLLERGEITDYELPIRTKSGDRREGSVSARVLYDDGEPVGFEGTLRDITVRNRLAEELRRHKEELEHAQRLRIMGEMVAQMAHELNQPLAAINAYAAACLRRVDSGDANSDKLAEGLARICEQALRAGEIIYRTRTFASKKAPRHETVDVVALLEEVLRLLEPECRQRSVTIRFDLPQRLPPVSADRVQIQLVIVNLLLNGTEALDSTSNDRVLSIVVSLIEDKAIEIAIRDSGRGLGVHGETVFEPFYTTKTEGLGMGLAISRSIVEAHGGRLWATPNAERGTTFHFTLPLPKQAGLMKGRSADSA
jgi:PAS domain S-box-containing protein